MLEDLKLLSITESVKPTGFNLEWDDERAFPESILNPHFVTSYESAKNLLSKGGPWDCLGSMGGFSWAVASTQMKLYASTQFALE